MFTWIFIIADIRTPILGADFLREYNLLVDVRHNRLRDTATVQGVLASPAPDDRPVCVLSHPPVQSMYNELLAEFPGLTRPYQGQLSVKHKVTHHIETTGPPVYTRARRLAPKRSLITCWSWASYVLHLVTGHRHYTSYRRRQLVTGALVGTIGPSITSQSQISTPYRISRTSLLNYMGLPSFPSWIWCVHTSRGSRRTQGSSEHTVWTL